MINSVHIQQSYNNLYKELRRYLWNYNVIEDICELELSCYKAFPSIQDIKNALQHLLSSISVEYRVDQELQEAVEDLKALIEQEDDDIFIKLSEF